MKSFLLLLGLIPLVVTAPVTAQSGNSGEAIVLRAGDAIRITVWRNAELSGEFSIAQDGTIRHPLYRSITVGGLDLIAAEERVRELLSGLESNPQFVIHPLFRVSVGGEVRQPSLYKLPPETSIAEAVALAGGSTDRGRLDRVRLLRGGREVFIDLTDPDAGLAQEPVRSGDQLFVQRRVSVFRDYIAPAGGITAALVSIVSLVLRNRN